MRQIRRAVELAAGRPGGFGTLVVMGASIGFALMATGVTWFAAVQRRGAWVAAAPRLYAEQAAELARRRQQLPTLQSDLNLQDWLRAVPEPSGAVGAIAQHIVVETMIFAAVCALVVTLMMLGRRACAAMVGAVAVVGVIWPAGPLSLLPGSLAGRVTPTPLSAMSDLPFTAPLWWRSLVAVCVALPLVAAAVVARTRDRSMTKRPVFTVMSMAAFGLAAEITVLTWPQSLVPDDSTVAAATPVAVSFLLFGLGATVAGSALPGRPGRLLVVALTALDLAAGVLTWVIYHRDGGAQQAFGWEMASSQPQWMTTPQLAALIAAATVLGWVAATAARTIAESRPVRTMALLRQARPPRATI